MTSKGFHFDLSAATSRLMKFLSVEGITGQEQAIGRDVVESLLEAGVPKKFIRFDDANKKIPFPTQTGNLLVTLPGTIPGARRLFMTHLDTVPLCAGAKPIRKGSRIEAAGDTALGGDNRTGVACLVTMIATLFEQKLRYAPMTVLFTVREESGLWGARFVEPADLQWPKFGFNVDGGSAKQITIGAVGAERWEVEITGRAAHAGVHPEKGISASMVVAKALSSIQAGGWFGKISLNGNAGTSNVGSLSGKDGGSVGEATNVVTDYALVRGESRSHNSHFVKEITQAYRQAFADAARATQNDQGRAARVRFQSRLDYYPFKLPESSPVVRLALAGVRSIGLDPAMRVTSGGLDANWLVRKRIPTITFGAGQNNVHTTEEFVDLREFENGCRLALALATMETN